jgi:tRNA-2-methylthio-N6-dimethylallyladenosine synthase
VRAVAEVRGVCAHLHMPVQSGSDRILRLMRRGYTAEEYRAAADRLRAAVPEIGLTTDVIVGFPSESEEDFDATRRFMHDVGFDQAYIFKYSPRPGTPAAGMDDDVTEEAKMRRNRVLLEELDRTALRINGALVGRTVEVLVEGPSLRNESRWAGRTETNKVVIFAPTGSVRKGDLATVAIDRVMAQTLYGDLCGAQSARGAAR